MSLAPFTRLATDADYRAAVSQTPPSTPATPTDSLLQPHLLYLAAQRLQAGALPPRCYVWWNNPPRIVREPRL